MRGGPKGSVSLILSDPPCKDGKAGITTVPLEAFFRLIILKILFFPRFKSVISDHLFPCSRDAEVIFCRENPQFENKQISNFKV